MDMSEALGLLGSQALAAAAAAQMPPQQEPAAQAASPEAVGEAVELQLPAALLVPAARAARAS